MVSIAIYVVFDEKMNTLIFESFAPEDRVPIQKTSHKYKMGRKSQPLVIFSKKSNRTNANSASLWKILKVYKLPKRPQGPSKKEL